MQNVTNNFKGIRNLPEALEKSFRDACASNIPVSVLAIGFFFALLGADKLLCKMLYNYRLKFDQESIQ